MVLALYVDRSWPIYSSVLDRDETLRDAIPPSTVHSFVKPLGGVTQKKAQSNLQSLDFVNLAPFSLQALLSRSKRH